MEQRFFKTTIILKVLHDQGAAVDQMRLEEVVRECVQGDFSGGWDSVTEEVSREDMAALLIEQGSDPDFIIDGYGEE